MRSLLITAVVLLAAIAVRGDHHGFCNSVAADCTANSTCAALFQDAGTKCASTFAAVIPCSVACNASWQALFKDPIGKRFMTCTCAFQAPYYDYGCVQVRDNTLFSCLQQPLPTSKSCVADSTPAPGWTPPKCGAVGVQCWNDSKCNQTLQVYIKACGSVLGGVATKCWPTCKNRVDDLFCDPIGKQFKGCQCDGADPMCFKESTYVGDLCFGQKYPAPPYSSQSCSAIDVACASDPKCNTTLLAFGKCIPDLLKPSPVCNPDCKATLQTLLQDPIGYNYLSCVCDNPLCNALVILESKYCFDPPIMSLKLSCDKVIGGCLAYSTCNSSLSTFLSSCGGSDPTATPSSDCPPQCVAPFKKIISNPVGSVLNTCNCDSSSPAENSECRLASSYIKACITATASTAPPTMARGTMKPKTVGPSNAAATVSFALSTVAAFVFASVVY